MTLEGRTTLVGVVSWGEQDDPRPIWKRRIKSLTPEEARADAERTKSGDRNAREKLIERTWHASPERQKSIALSSPHDDAMSVAQVAMIEVIDNLDGFDPASVSLVTFACVHSRQGKKRH